MSTTLTVQVLENLPHVLEHDDSAGDMLTLDTPAAHNVLGLNRDQIRHRIKTFGLTATQEAH